MGIVDKKNAMNLAVGLEFAAVSGEDASSLLVFSDVEVDKKSLDNLLNYYKGFVEKMQELHDRASQEMMKLQAAQLEGMAAETLASQHPLKLIEDERVNAIVELRNKMQEFNLTWEQIWGVTGQLMTGGVNDVVKAMEKKVNELAGMGTLTVKVRNELLEKLKVLKIPENEEEGTFERLSKSVGKLFESMGKGAEMTQKEWENLGESLGDVSKIFSQSLDGLNKIGAEFGMSKEAQATFSQISGMVSGMGSMAKGLASGDVSSIISGGVGMITSATKLFDFKTKKADKEIKKHAKNLKELDKLYEQFGREADKALGTETYQKQLEQAKNLEQQKIEVEAQMEAEKSKRKKKRDKGKIDEYEKQIKNLEKRAEDVKQNIVDEMMTTDLKSFASQLASSIVTAFSAGTEDFDGIMQGKIDDLIKNMLMKQVAMNVVQGALKGVFDKAAKFTEEGSEDGVGFSTGEIRQLKEALEDSKTAIKSGFGVYGDVMKEFGYVADKQLSDRVKGVTGQLEAAMTEGTASELVGLWTATAMDIRVIREWLLVGTDVSLPENGFNMSEFMEQQYMIERNTRVTAESTMASVYHLQEGFGRMGRQLEAIERNTRGYGGRGR